MPDPSMPTYAAGTISLMSSDTLADSGTNGIGSIRSTGVGTSNAEWVNYALSNATPKAFPGLQT